MTINHTTWPHIWPNMAPRSTLSLIRGWVHAHGECHVYCHREFMLLLSEFDLRHADDCIGVFTHRDFTPGNDFGALDKLLQGQQLALGDRES
jgi:hypothetical protein